MRFLTVLLLLSLSSMALCHDNGVALTPPMVLESVSRCHRVGCRGCGSGPSRVTLDRWECEVDCVKHPKDCINEDLIVEQIDAVVSKGLLTAGYNYVNIDDCWESFDRDSEGRLQANATRFPHGMKWLSSYANQKGVKLGSYTDYGTKTCGGYPGSKGYVEIDAQTFASWNIENLKVDGCWADKSEYKDGYTQLSQALNKSGVHIVYACSWPAYDQNASFPYLETICNLWRPWYDIGSNWYSVSKIIEHWGDLNFKFVNSTGPGHWVDPDMLVIGNGGKDLGKHEYKTQMAMWSIFAAPLYISADVRNMTQENLDILLNREVIAIDQDPLGHGGRMMFRNDNYEVWTRTLVNSSYAVAVYNKLDKAIDVVLNPVAAGVTYKGTASFWEVNYKAMKLDVPAGKTISLTQIPAHATYLFRVTL